MNRSSTTFLAALGLTLLAACGGGDDAPTTDWVTASAEATTAVPPTSQTSADGLAPSAQRERKMAAPGGSARPAVAGGYAHSLTLKSDGTVWAWGLNSNGQLGNNSTATGLVPVRVAGAGGVGVLTGATAIAAGYAHSLALKSDGTAWAWGYNSSGQLGNNSTADSHVPVQVLGLGGVGVLTSVTAIAAGWFHSLALTSDGTVWAWGPTSMVSWASTAPPPVSSRCRCSAPAGSGHSPA